MTWMLDMDILIHYPTNRPPSVAARIAALDEDDLLRLSLDGPMTGSDRRFGIGPSDSLNGAAPAPLEDQKISLRPASLAAAAVAALAGTPALAAPPTAPSDLRVDVYSDTAAELFWARSTDPDGLVRGYEIRRDGELLDTRDALSYFTDELTDGRAFAFSVTAIDFDGERSAPASVSVVGGDRGGTVGSGGGRPPPPANLTSSVYSSSAAEVFWDRNRAQGLSYEVRLDGEPVRTTSGTSAFLSGLSGARGRTVDVVAIDANGRRSGAASVRLGDAGDDDPNPPSSGNATAAPSNLRAELYSSSAGEVFWDRVSGANLSYEVSLDGEVAATTDGTSYFVGNRPGLDGTTVEVVAIGPDGTRSGASSTVLGSGGPSNPDPGTDAPPAPTNARIEVYSSTAAELFWDRPPAAADVDVARITRDGAPLGTTSGTSFFDDGRAPGRDYRYAVTFVDAAGIESAPATIGGDAVPSADTLLGGEDAPRTLLPRLLGVARGEPVDDFLDRVALPRIAPSAIDAPPPGLTLTGRSDGEDFSDVATYDCDAGGSLTVTVGAAIQDRVTEYEADGCTVGGATHDGTYVTRDARAANDRSFRGPLEIVSGAASATGSGALRRSFATALPNGRVTREAGPLRFEQGPRAGLTLSSYRTVLTYDDAPADEPAPTKSLSTSFTLEAPWTGELSVEVETVREFDAYDGEVGAYTIGALEVRAPDGSAWRLDAGTGDPMTFALAITDGGASRTETLFWNDEDLRLPCLSQSDTSGTAAERRRCEPIFGSSSQ